MKTHNLVRNCEDFLHNKLQLLMCNDSVYKPAVSIVFKTDDNPIQEESYKSSYNLNNGSSDHYNFDYLPDTECAH